MYVPNFFFRAFSYLPPFSQNLFFSSVEMQVPHGVRKSQSHIILSLSGHKMWRYLQMWRMAQKHLSNQRLELLHKVQQVSHGT